MTIYSIYFKNTRDQGGYVLLPLLQNENQDETFHNGSEKVIVKSDIIDGGIFCSRKNIENGD